MFNCKSGKWGSMGILYKEIGDHPAGYKTNYCKLLRLDVVSPLTPLRKHVVHDTTGHNLGLTLWNSIDMVEVDQDSLMNV